MALAEPALANVPLSGGPIGSVQSVGQANLARLCALPPSATTCMDGDYLKSCPGAQPTASTRTMTGSLGCGPFVTTTYSSRYAPAKTKSTKIILPYAMVQQTGVATAGTVFTDAFTITSQSGLPQNTGTKATIGGDFFKGLAFYATAATTSPRYSPADQTMHSCAEYVWKKWGTYSHFKDVAHYLGNDYEAIVTAANQDANIASNVVRQDGRPISVNGASMPYQASGSYMWRNPFMAIVPAWLDANDTAQAQIIATINAKSAVMWMTGSANDVVWANAMMKAQSAAGVVTANYEDNERRMNAYAALADHLAITQAELELVMAPPSNYAAIQPKTPLTPPFYGTQSAKRAASVANAQRMMSHVSVTPVAPATPTIAAAMGGGTVTTPAPAPCTDVPKMCQIKALRAEITATANKMTAMLLAEWAYDANHGCLGYTFNGHALDVNACDYNPRIFAEKYSDLFAADRQNAYARCIADTGDDFAVMTSPQLQAAIWKDRRFTDNQTYNDNLTDIDNKPGVDALGHPVQTDFFGAYESRAQINDAEKTFQKIREAQYAKLTADLPLQGASTSPRSIGDSMQDGNDIGGDWFGGGYGYSAGWSVTPHSESEFADVKAKIGPNDVPRICRLDGEVHATLNAHATLLKIPIDIVDAALRAHTEADKAVLDDAHLTFFGNDVIFQQSGDFTGRTFDVPVDSTPASPSFSVFIPLLGIPIEVGGGATVHVGADFKFTAQAPPRCDRNNVGFSAIGSVGPSLQVDAKAWAAINLGVVSAGIEGQVNLFTVNVPISTKVYMPVDGNGINLAIDTDADLQLSELSGKLDVYAEVNLLVWSDRAQFDLFSWGGLHQEVPLFHRHKSYPIDAINYAIFGVVNP